MSNKLPGYEVNMDKKFDKASYLLSVGRIIGLLLLTAVILGVFALVFWGLYLIAPWLIAVTLGIIVVLGLAGMDYAYRRDEGK